MPQPVKHLLPKIILLLSGLAILAALSIGAEQTIMEVKPPNSCFNHAPSFSGFQLRVNGEVVYEKAVGRNLSGTEKEQAVALAAELGRPAYDIPGSMHRPFIQSGNIRVVVPISFSVQGHNVGTTAWGVPLYYDQIEVAVAVRRYGLFPRDYTCGGLDWAIYKAAIDGVDVRIKDLAPHVFPETSRLGN
jgi:hypothetical protein